MEKEQIKAIIDKVDVEPFYFGSDNASYFWRVVKFEEFIYAERAVLIDDVADNSYFCCLACDEGSREDIYSDILMDFSICYRDTWYYARNTDVFRKIAGPDDASLLDILDIFRRDYADFLNDAMLFFSIVLEVSEPEEDDVAVEVIKSGLSEDARIAKQVLERTARCEPLTIACGDTTYLWQLVSHSGEIWFGKTTMHSRGEYVYVSEEYGHVAVDNEDAFEALRDAVRGSFLIDGWEIIETDVDVNEVLALVNFSLDELSE